MQNFESDFPDKGRQRDLVEATLECISELGIQATTVRAVAARAGVSSGLIRHHFNAKANLIVAAYRRTIDLIISATMRELNSTEGSPREKLRRSIVATLDTPASDYRMLSLWATFVSQSRVDPLVAAVRDESYLDLRRATESVLAAIFQAEGRYLPADELENMSVVVQAVLDGLWIEACLAESRESVERLIALGIESVEKLLGVTLNDPAT